GAAPLRAGGALPGRPASRARRVDRRPRARDPHAGRRPRGSRRRVHGARQDATRASALRGDDPPPAHHAPARPRPARAPHLDAATTILDLVGAPPIAGTDGVSLVPLLMGSSLPEWRTAVFSEAKSGLSVPRIDLVSSRVGVARCTLRLQRGAPLCYDLTRDPE